MLSMPLIPIVRGKKTGKKQRMQLSLIYVHFGVALTAIILPLGGFVSAEQHKPQQVQQLITTQV